MLYGHGVVTAAVVFIGRVAEILAAPPAAGEHGAAEGAARGLFAGAAETAGSGEAAAGEDEQTEEEQGEEDEEDEGAEDGAD